MEARLRLWEIADALGEITERLVDNGGELTPEIEAEFDALEGTFLERAERLALYARECHANAAGSKIEEERLQAIRKAFEARERGLKAYLKLTLEKAGRDRVETPKARVRIQANSQSSISYDGIAAKLPVHLQKITIEPNYMIVRERLEAGEPLPAGFTQERGTHVRIY